MKVRVFLKKYRLCSNADVFLQTPDGEFAKLESEEIKELNPEALMNATVNSFDIIDNILTVHIR